jgi:hypothetical protein
MSKAVKAAWLAFVMFVTVWAVTLWQWHRSQKSVTGEAAATQLVFLPMGITLIALLAWAGASRLRAWLSQPIEAGAARSALDVRVAAPLDSAQPDATPVRLACILAEAVSLPQGDDPEQAWSALRESRVRPALDPFLQDADGLPVFTSRLPDLSIAEWLDAHAELADVALPECVLRAMALIESPWYQLLAALPDVRCMPGVGAHADEESASLNSTIPMSLGPTCLSGVGQSQELADLARRHDMCPTLDIQIWLPSAWLPGHREAFVDWLKLQAGGAQDWTQSAGSGEPTWTPLALDAPEEGWDSLVLRLQQLDAASRPGLLIVLAVQSLVDDNSVMSMQARGELFTGRHQAGRVPGEGAAGLLLSNALVRGVDSALHPWLGQPAAVTRQRSADHNARPGSAELVAAAREAMQPWGHHLCDASAKDAWWCVSDADHRPSRATELFEASLTLQPQADASQAVQRLGDAWGDLGVARALVPAALGSAAVRQGLSPSGDGELGARQPDACAVPALVALTQCSHRRWVIPIWPSRMPCLAATELAPVVQPLAA